jgi:hypothetical protein
MLRYCPVAAFEDFIALPKGCNLDAVLIMFKTKYKLYDFRSWLWRISEASLTHDDLDSEERKDFIRFLHELECVMEVVYLGNWDKSKNRT